MYSFQKKILLPKPNNSNSPLIIQQPIDSNTSKHRLYSNVFNSVDKDKKKIPSDSKVAICLSDFLNNLPYYGPIFKNQSAVKTYKPKLFSFYEIDREKVNDCFREVSQIALKDLVYKDEICISQDQVSDYLSDFKKGLTDLLIGDGDQKEEFIERLFYRLFAVNVVSAIREYKITPYDLDNVTEDEFTQVAQQLYNNKPVFSEDESQFISRMRPHHTGVKLTDYFMKEEMQNTTKVGTKSTMDTWCSDIDLHGKVRYALDTFFSAERARKKPFSLKNILAVINMPGNQVSHFRPVTVTEIYQYLVDTKNIDPTKAIKLFDSSIGWLDRLTGAVLCNEGKAFNGYTGCDPNPVVILKAHDMLKKLMPVYNKGFSANFYLQGIETSSVKHILAKNGGHFELALTSPPFPNNEELYGKGGLNVENQVWYKYRNEKEYLEKFLVPLLRINYELLTAGGIFILHFNNEKMVQDALAIHNRMIIDIQFQMQIWQQGTYYPTVYKESRGYSTGEHMFFFKRGNRLESVPKLISGPETILEDDNGKSLSNEI